MDLDYQRLRAAIETVDPGEAMRLYPKLLIAARNYSKAMKQLETAETSRSGYVEQCRAQAEGRLRELEDAVKSINFEFGEYKETEVPGLPVDAEGLRGLVSMLIAQAESRKAAPRPQ